MFPNLCLLSVSIPLLAVVGGICTMCGFCVKSCLWWLVGYGQGGWLGQGLWVNDIIGLRGWGIISLWYLLPGRYKAKFETCYEKRKKINTKNKKLKN